MSTRNAKSIVALAALAATPIFDISTFNPRFEDTGGQAAAAGASAPPAGQQQQGSADPVVSLREEFNRLRTESLNATQAAQTAGRALTDAEVQENERRFTRMNVVEATLREFSRFAARQLPADAAGAQSTTSAGDGSGVQPAQPAPPGREQFERGQPSPASTGLMPGQRTGESRELYDGRVRETVNTYLRTGVDRTSQFVVTRGTDSGALVPTRLQTPVVIKRISNPFRAALAARGLRTLSSSSTETIRIPVLDDTGNVATVIAENATGDNPLDPTVTGMTLGAKLYDSGTVWFSNSLRLAMDFDLYGYVDPRLDERIEQKQTVEWTTSCTTTGTVGKVTASASGVTYNELLQWQHSMPVIRRAAGVFIISDGLLLALRGLTDGNGRLIFQESARDDAPDRLLGWPVFVSAELLSPASNVISGIAISADGLHIREVTPTRVVRYAELPQWPDQFGVRKFANGDFAFEPTAVRLLKHAA